MTPTSQPTALSLTQICESYEKIVKSAAAAEAAVTVAEEEYKVAKIDDGKMDPAEIYERKTAAKKKLFIREAEAKRAATKLEEETSSFGRTIESLAAPLLGDLTKVRKRNADQLTKELGEKLPDNPFNNARLTSFVDRCNGVAEFDLAIACIHQGLGRLESHGAQASGLINALKQAERLLGSAKQAA